MECHVADALMDEYVAGRLDDGSASQVAAHLAGCRHCRELEADLLRVLTAVTSLPESVEPPPAVWERIAESIGGRGRVLPGRFGGSPGRFAGLLLAAVAALALVLAAVVSLRQSPGPAVGRLGSVEVTPAVWTMDMHGQLARVRQELRLVLASRQDTLAPDTLAVITENLRIIEQALKAMEAALEADPGNGQLVNLLLATYQQEIDLLTQAALAPSA